MQILVTNLPYAARVLVTALLCALTVEIPSVFCQSNASSPRRSSMGIEYWIKPDGKMSIAHVNISSTAASGSIEYLPFLRNADIQLELELTDAQKSELDKLSSSINETETEIDELKKRDDSEGSNVRTAIREHQAVIEKMLTEGLNDFLLPHQERRLVELRNRFEIRRVGLYSALMQENVSTVLNVTPEQKKQLGEIASKLHGELTSESKQLKDEFINAMLDCLTEFQRQKLNEATSELQFYRNVFLELMILQSETDEFDSLGPETELKHAALVIPFEYAIEHDGSFLRSQNKRQSDSPAYTVASSLQQALSESELQTLLELSDNQLALLDELGREQEDWGEEMTKRINEDLVNNSGENVKQISRSAFQFREQLSVDQIDRIETSLLPFQAAILDRVVNNIKLVRSGLLYSLTHDSLGEELEISESQKRKMADQAGAVARKIRKRGVEIERLVETKLNEALDRQQREKLESWLGAPIQHGDANFDLTILQLDSTKLGQFRQWILISESIDEDN